MAYSYCSDQRFNFAILEYFYAISLTYSIDSIIRHYQVGTYDPLPVAGRKMVSLNIDRIKHWLGAGATPSEPVAKLLGKAGLLPPFPMRMSTSGAMADRE